MCKLERIMFLAVGLGTSSMALAEWESAYSSGESDTGDIRYTRCHYETIGGFRFSIIVKGICPVTIEFNPETQQWRKSF
ncbi:hypothetical protein [Actinobacillus minor]|uniref:hypothetical protein n=1 Tax=Actinobacillus minor TaxID=51047 RepID=UPI0023F57836|nr:hypothetical protein [Actinobacillus minor]MDD6911737.1 hypothetical protein [Actinobacillus minor]MDY4712790.1 hypothetical protein [Actinobacillus minor]